MTTARSSDCVSKHARGIVELHMIRMSDRTCAIRPRVSLVLLLSARQPEALTLIEFENAAVIFENRNWLRMEIVPT